MSLIVDDTLDIGRTSFPEGGPTTVIVQNQPTVITALTFPGVMSTSVIWGDVYLADMGGEFILG